MRTSRRFRPALDCMSARIAPSTISLLPAAGPMVAVGSPIMDSTGNPTTEPTSGGTNPVLPASNGTGGTGGVC